MALAVTVLEALVALTAGAILVLAIGQLRPPAPPPARARRWPSIDVVVPARNEEPLLPRVLASLLAQDYPGTFTVWIVDDRSTDGTREVARRAAAQDGRVRIVCVDQASRRWAPKVNAVRQGILAGEAEWIVTTDADCQHRRGWLRALLSEADDDVVLVAGHVETARDGGARGLLGRYEALDWLSLMFTVKALTRFGAMVAASANNQAYARSAWQAVGGFGVAARAPSGDEDLLAQRLGRLRGSRMVFTDHPEARVSTTPMPGWHAFLDQRRRWVSRYQHAQQYHPAFIAGVAVLGAACVGLALALPAALVAPGTFARVVPVWGVLLAVQVLGMHVGLAGSGRRDLRGWPVVAWASLYPFVIALAVLWSLLRPGSWRAGARSYRRRLWRARWRRRRSPRWRPPRPAGAGEVSPTEGPGDRW
jgi:cellulose synthase/poly-beta-1,6-N-acetylglucosamine synthase-like glycosyltransferase